MITIYRTQIVAQPKTNWDKWDKVVDKAFKMSYDFKDMEFMYHEGSPASLPYLEFESENKQNCFKLLRMIETYINRFNGIDVIIY